MGASEHYRSQRERVSELVAGLDQEQLRARVPGCPAWDARELLSHLTGVTADVAQGRLDGAGQPPWTAKQVADRQGVGVPDLLAEWDRFGPQLEAVLDDFGRLGWVLVWDVTMHEDDLREALRLPLAVGETQDTVLDGLATRAGKKVAEAGLPPLRLETDGRAWTLGAGDPSSTLAVGDPGELARVLGGRRSHDAMRGLDWQVDPEVYLPHLTLFPPG